MKTMEILISLLSLWAFYVVMKAIDPKLGIK